MDGGDETSTVMTPDQSDTTANAESEQHNTSRLNRRLILGALGTLTGLSAFTNAGSALEDGKVITRGCHDEALKAQDWSTGAVTIQACPNGQGGTAMVRVTGRLGFERYAQPRRQPRGGQDQSTTAEQSQRVVVKQGQEVDSAGGTTAEQSQTVIVKQEQTVSDDESHLPEVELTLRPGERQTVWYTGTIAGYEMSNNNLNVGMANRFD